MAYFLGRDVSVKIKAGDDVGANTDGTVDVDGSTPLFASTAGTTVTDLTGVDLGIGVTDEDITYMGSRTVLKAEIKKETTITLTRKKKDNVWDVIFNASARWGAKASDGGFVSGLEAPDLTSGVTYGYQVEITLKASTEVFKVPNAVITGHTVSLNADGTTEETLEFISYETPSIATS
tara:strand:+ start:77 stop:610 length:534 start_codon:yes stop_codon:yes gene_type:complete